jgi:anthranilate synthase component 1
MLYPTLEQFKVLAGQGNLVPVYREIVADLETPLTLFSKLEGQKNAFLLESAEKGGKFSRYSFLGANPSMTLTADRGHYQVIENGISREFHSSRDPLTELQEIMAKYKPVPHGDLPLFYGGAVGYLAYESATYFEKTVPRAKKDDLQLPDAVFGLSDTLYIFDHQSRKILLVANAHIQTTPEVAYQEAVQKIEGMKSLLLNPLNSSFLESQPSLPELSPQVNMTQEHYLSMTAEMQEYIKSGDIFQVVPSQRFEVPFAGKPLDLYRALRTVNPSPYMFCLQYGEYALVGASPEVHARCENGLVTIRPIAGTRPRGTTPEKDEALAQELLADPKERAEHVMLVDLARNDVGRVCEFQSVTVTDFMTIERYSHVMHIVSNVIGKLHSEMTSYDVMRATFPAGTVSGSPKVRAMQIIAEQEPTCRGSYAGAVGYFGFSGNLDSCIALRTALLKNGKAYVQAGGGLVADSTPLGEYQESVNKAKATMKSLAVAQSICSK